MDGLPEYDDLPPAPKGGRSAWGVFGRSDGLGTLNLQTPERIAEAARLVRRGAVFSLNAPIDAFVPPIAPFRSAPRHRVLTIRPGTFDDVIDNFFPQASSQWDALSHVGYGPGQFYNGATEEEITSGGRNTIEHWARRGIAGRAVVLDMVGALARAGRPFNPGEAVAFSLSDLELAREASGLEFRAGDILVLHTGFASWWRTATEPERAEVARTSATPGIAHDEAIVRFLWNSRVSAVVTDTFAVEVFPPDPTVLAGNLHRILIGQLGMALGELWWLEDLVADCRADGVYEAFLTSAPLHVRGGIGSPANALAFK